MPIDLILGADNLRMPLTGIGRYAYELAIRMENRPEIEGIRYFSLGRWVEPCLQTLSAGGQPNTCAGTGPSLSLVSRLAMQPWATRVYGMATPALFRWQLRKLTSRSVFHAPNFLAPPCDARKVTTVHDLSHEVLPHCHPPARVSLMNQAFPRSLARSDHVITVSETVRQELISRHAFPPDRVTAIHLAADASYRPQTPEALASILAPLGLAAGRYTLFVGTIEPRKNVRRLLDAYSQLPAAVRRECPLVVAGGPGWNSDDIHARLAEAQDQGWCRYLAFVDQYWLPALYAGARIMAYPSLYEGFGLPIVEAMACGTPVLTSNTSCMPEVAAGAARLVNPLDVDDMAHALGECLLDEAWQAQARELGLVRASTLSWDRCVEQTVAVYRQLV